MAEVAAGQVICNVKDKITLIHNHCFLTFFVVYLHFTHVLPTAAVYNHGVKHHSSLFYAAGDP